MRLLLFVLLVVALGNACEPDAGVKSVKTYVVSAEDRALLERLKAKEKAKKELLRVPSRFIGADNYESVNRGLINNYTRADAVTFSNRSQFDVSDIRGKIHYLRSDGSVIAAVPFKASGNLRSGETKRMEITAAEITGRAPKAKLLIEKVRLRQ